MGWLSCASFIAKYVEYRRITSKATPFITHKVPSIPLELSGTYLIKFKNWKEDFMTIHDKTVRFHRDKFLCEMSNESE